MNAIYEENRIYMLGENEEIVSEVTFPWIEKNVVCINHVFVSPILRGKGVASRLMDMTVCELEKRNILCTVTCPYALQWFEKHPEKKNILYK